jgi:hypothetical protein
MVLSLKKYSTKGGEEGKRLVPLKKSEINGIITDFEKATDKIRHHNSSEAGMTSTHQPEVASPLILNISPTDLLRSCAVTSNAFIRKIRSIGYRTYF